MELRALLIAAQRTRRGALIAALAPLAPLRNLADASDVGEDVAAPTETEWLDAVECMAEPLCVELARTLEDATTLILSLERAEGLQAALDAQHEQKLAEHEERMSGGGGDAEVDAEDLARDREAVLRAAMPASRAAGITRRQCYEAALRRDSHDATARAQLEEVRSRLRVTWREKRLDEALTALRDGRAGAGWLIGPEDVLDEPWQVSDAQLRELMRGVRLAGAALEREARTRRPLARAIRSSGCSLPSTARMCARWGARVAKPKRRPKRGTATATRRRTLGCPSTSATNWRSHAIEGFADVYFRVRRHESARVRLNDSDRLFLRASKTARALYDNPDNPRSTSPTRPSACSGTAWTWMPCAKRLPATAPRWRLTTPLPR